MNSPKYLSHPIFTAAIVFLLGSCKQAEKETLALHSPDKRITVLLENNDRSGVTYSIKLSDTLVMEKSDLGLILADGDYFKSLTCKSATQLKSIEDNYALVHGKRKQIKYRANQKTFHCENSEGKPLDIVFNVSNDGVAFKYHFPDSSAKIHHIIDEKTAFQFSPDTKAFLQPMSEAKTGWNQCNPSYEEYYMHDIPTNTVSPLGAGWAFPALFKSGNRWILLTESGLQRNYCGSRLDQKQTNDRYEIGFPSPKESVFGGPVLPESSLPWSSPWRIIAIGNLANIIESTLGTDVSEPAISVDQSFIKPGLASWSWALLKDESVNYDVQKRFIDYASEMNWPYCLVDVNWDSTIGYHKMAELNSYARSKKVGLFLWYNSAGDWNTTPYHPRSKLLTAQDREKEFATLNEMGIAGIKVDFFGGDGQSVIGYYHDILKDAARHKLLVNFHGATLPRGWQRTYPHLMTMESIRGFEFVTFEQRNADVEPEHCALIPFLRNAFDPMDFTPMSLYKIPNIKRKTSAAFELALPVLFLSGVQHIAETPDGLSHVPAFVKEYLKDIPTDWDDTKFLEGYPGNYVAVARRKKAHWFISGINAMENTQHFRLDLSFIETKQGISITDDKDSFVKKEINLNDHSTLDLNIPAKGGFVMKF
jgi:hypothetical protein